MNKTFIVAALAALAMVACERKTDDVTPAVVDDTRVEEVGAMEASPVIGETGPDLTVDMNDAAANLENAASEATQAADNLQDAADKANDAVDSVNTDGSVVEIKTNP